MQSFSLMVPINLTKRTKIKTKSTNPYLVSATFGRVSSVHFQALNDQKVMLQVLK